MKRTIYLLMVGAMIGLGACTQQKPQPSQPSQGEALLQILNAEQKSLIVLNHDSMSMYNGRGVQDLLRLVTEEPERLEGAIVADKIIGKASATLMVAGGVSEVHTNIISTPAMRVFKEAGVKVHAEEEVAQILNRDQSGQCPIDGLLNEAETVEECVEILKERFQ